MSVSCLQIDQITNESFVRISALASKRRSNQKKSCNRVKIIELVLFFVSTLFRGLGRNSYKDFVGFMVDLKTPKGYFEINRPLMKAIYCFSGLRTVLESQNLMIS